jgi:hypothetical protein
MVESGDIIIVTEENQKQKVLPYNKPKVAISPKVVEIKPQDDKLVVPRIEVNYLEEKKPIVVETKVEEVKEVKSKINKRK